MNNQPKIAIVGLGYVGLPLAVAFAEKYSVIGLDINTSRIKELRSGTDTTLEVSDELLQSVVETSADAATGTARCCLRRWTTPLATNQKPGWLRRQARLRTNASKPSRGFQIPSSQ